MREDDRIGKLVMRALIAIIIGAAGIAAMFIVPKQFTQNQGNNTIIEVSNVFFQEVRVFSSKKMPPGQGTMRGLQLVIEFSCRDDRVVRVHFVTPDIGPGKPGIYNVYLWILGGDYCAAPDSIYHPGREGSPYFTGKDYIDELYLSVNISWPSFYTKTDVYGGSPDDRNWKFYGYKMMPLDTTLTLTVKYDFKYWIEPNYKSKSENKRQWELRHEEFTVELPLLKTIPIYENPALSNLAKAYDIPD